MTTQKLNEIITELIWEFDNGHISSYELVNGLKLAMTLESQSEYRNN